MEVAKENKAQQTQEPIKVLIADDDPPTRMLLKAAIAQWGYEVSEANDGDVAWKILQGPNPPDLVILDWIMPKLDGPTLCELIKHELSYAPYIILLTQVTGTTNIIKGLEAGADEFLSKPFNMAELRSRLSVGARIINYKKQLEKQNKQIADYILSSDKIVQLILETSEKITGLINSLQINKIETENAKKILELQNNLKTLTDTLHDINHFQK